ncbi:heterocyst frequency control protein PatD [Nostoc sp. UHCC 0302]|uniref:heterocyst frequency control protein PatD n=1 Tax=Nostoc sp. UHCC 0302 TaxID=3134896 RepID=UPI00311CA4DA
MSLNREKYRTLAALLEQLRADVNANQFNAPTLQQRVASLQQFFRQQIVPLADVGVRGAPQSEDSLQAEDWREQSIKTEISKQLRLLEVDVMFFQGARQAPTAQARLQTIGDRLAILIQYCNAILQQQAEGEK